MMRKKSSGLSLFSRMEGPQGSLKTSFASYTDPWTLVVKFCWGLKLNVQSQITTMPFEQPADTNSEA